jgi:fatty acyl-ACP thioesterase B
MPFNYFLFSSSLFLMMNKKTRKLSFVKEAWAEIEPHVLNCDPIINKDKRKLLQLDLDTADYVRIGIVVSVLNFKFEA